MHLIETTVFLNRSRFLTQPYSIADQPHPLRWYLVDCTFHRPRFMAVVIPRTWCTGLLLLLLLLESRRATAQTWTLLARTESNFQEWASLSGVALAPDGDVVTTGGTNGTLNLGAAGLIGRRGYSNPFVARRGNGGAGPWRWAATMFSPTGAGVTRVLVLPDNDVLVLGFFTNPSYGVDFGPLNLPAGAGTYDGFVARLNGATGAWRWVARLATVGSFTHAQPFAMALRGATEAVVVGTFNGTMQLGALPSINSARPGGPGTANWDLFVARLDVRTGEWVQGFGAGGPGTEEATDVVALPGGEVAIAGTLEPGFALGALPPLAGASGRPQAFVARLDPVATQWRWVQQVEASTLANGQRLVALPGGDVAVSGKYAGAAQLGPWPLAPTVGAGAFGGFVGRLQGSDGRWLWATAGGGTGRPMGPGGLAVSRDGNVLIVNGFDGQARFGNLPALTARGPNPDLYVGQLASLTGAWQWVSQAGGDGLGGSRTPGYPFAGDDFAGDVQALDGPHLLVAGAFCQGARLGAEVGPLGTYLTDGFLARVSAPAPCPDTASGPAAGLRIVRDSAGCGAGLTLRAVGAPAGSRYTWSTGAEGAALPVTQAGTYGVRVTTPGGCQFRASYAQTAVSLPATSARFANVITPNGDGRNDHWVVPGLPAGARLRVFSRWGQPVYESSHYRNDWAAEGLPAGPYYFLLEHAQLCPRPQVKGWIEVLR